MAKYAADQTLREGRAAYFAENGFGADGNYAARWVKLKLGPLPVGFPNTDARRRAVRFFFNEGIGVPPQQHASLHRFTECDGCHVGVRLVVE